MACGARWTDRGVVSIGAEGEYGVLPSAPLSPFPLFGSAAAFVEEMDVRTRNEGSSFSGLTQSRARRSVTNLPPLLTDLTGEQGVWMDALAAGGFRYRHDLSTASRDVWRAERDANASVSAKLNVDGLQHTVLGCRGSVAVFGDAGGAAQMRADLSGIPSSDMDTAALIADNATLDQPIIVCGAQFVIEIEGATSVTPVLRAFNIATGRTLAERRAFSRSTSVAEVRPLSRASVWGCSIDQGATDWVALQEAGTKFGLSMTLSLGARSIECRSLGRNAYLSAPPRLDTGSSVLGVALVFGLIGQADGDLELIRT